MIYNFYAYPPIYQFQLFIQVIGTMTIHEGNGFTEVGLLVILLGDQCFYLYLQNKLDDIQITFGVVNDCQDGGVSS